MWNLSQRSHAGNVFSAPSPPGHQQLPGTHLNKSIVLWVIRNSWMLQHTILHLQEAFFMVLCIFNQAFLHYEIRHTFVEQHANDRALVENLSEEQLCVYLAVCGQLRLDSFKPKSQEIKSIYPRLHGQLLLTQITLHLTVDVTATWWTCWTPHSDEFPLIVRRKNAYNFGSANWRLVSNIFLPPRIY